jgi:hypothetical protein
MDITNVRQFCRPGSGELGIITKKGVQATNMYKKCELTFKSQFIMVFDAYIDAKGDRTDHSNHHTEVSLISIHNKSILGTLGNVAVILGLAIAVWIFNRKRITKHRRRHTALLAITYSPVEQSLCKAEGGDSNYQQPQQPHEQGSSQLGSPPTQ